MILGLTFIGLRAEICLPGGGTVLRYGAVDWLSAGRSAGLLMGKIHDNAGDRQILFWPGRCLVVMAI